MIRPFFLRYAAAMPMFRLERRRFISARNLGLLDKCSLVPDGV
jgi:hypothetical protein